MRLYLLAEPELVGLTRGVHPLEVVHIDEVVFLSEHLRDVLEAQDESRKESLRVQIVKGLDVYLDALKLRKQNGVDLFHFVVFEFITLGFWGFGDN